jgi:hypothetical protein
MVVGSNLCIGGVVHSRSLVRIFAFLGSMV